jgi:hypothetical protein
MNALSELLGHIAQETAGFKIGAPWSFPGRASVVSVLPITRRARLGRHYVTTSPPGHGLVIADTGDVFSVNIENTLETLVFLSAGQMLSGDVQERAVARSIILQPHQTRPVSVFCVHKSDLRLTGGAGMTVGPDVPREVEQELHATKERVASNLQDGVWVEIERSGREIDPSEEQPDDLRRILDIHRGKMQTILGQVPEIPDQVGMAIVVGSGIYSLQVFDSPDSWRERRKALIEKELSGLGRTAEDSPTIGGANSDDITRIFREFISQEFESDQVETGPGWKTLAIDSGNHAGEATILNGGLVHFSLGLKPLAMQLESVAAESKHDYGGESGKKYGRGFIHADQVTKISLNLYESLVSLKCFRKSKADLFRLRAAGYLHDVGFPPDKDHNINGFNWLKTRLGILVASRALSKADYRIILHCVLWHRGKDFNEIDADLKLGPQERITARRLAGVLQIADGLSFPDGTPTMRVHTFQEGDVLVIEACPSKHGDSLQAQTGRAMTKKNLLEAVLKTVPRLGISKSEIRKCGHDDCLVG